MAGFGSLLSESSARATFPDLANFRLATVPGFRRVFAHTTAVFHARGVARPAPREVASLSAEPCHATSLRVTLFDVPLTPEVAAAWVDREHEFAFLAVEAVEEEGGGGEDPALAGASGAALTTTPAVMCAAWNDAEYRATRCPPGEWDRRYRGAYPDGTPYDLTAVWDDPDVLPCRAYLRHCVLAARRAGVGVEACLLDNTFLADRATTVRAYLAGHPVAAGLMDEAPPPELAARYSG